MPFDDWNGSPHKWTKLVAAIWCAVYISEYHPLSPVLSRIIGDYFFNMRANSKAMVTFQCDLWAGKSLEIKWPGSDCFYQEQGRQWRSQHCCLWSCFCQFFFFENVGMLPVLLGTQTENSPDISVSKCCSMVCGDWEY